MRNRRGRKPIRVVTMITAAVVVMLIAVAVIWYRVERGSQATITHDDFDDAYDEFVTKGEIVDPDRDAAWRDFDAWQVESEKERRSWEEGAGE